MPSASRPSPTWRPPIPSPSACASGARAGTSTGWPTPRTSARWSPSARCRSLSTERTLAADIVGAEAVRGLLAGAADEVARRLRQRALLAGGVRVKLKTHRFQTMSRQATLDAPTNDAAALLAAADRLLAAFELGEPLRSSAWGPSTCWPPPARRSCCSPWRTHEPFLVDLPGLFHRGRRGLLRHGRPGPAPLGPGAPVLWGLAQWLGQVVIPAGPMHFLVGLGLQGVAGFLGVWLYQMARLQRMRRLAGAP
ncbi:MAG: hypothetical protein R3F60_33990 [bacterium]